MAGHLGTVAGAAADLVGWCAEDADARRPVDLHELSMRFALHALGRAVFGDDIVRAAPTLRRALPPLGEHLKRRWLSPVRTPHSWPTPANRRAEAVRRTVWGLADELIAQRRAAAPGGGDLLSRLLDPRDPETGDGLADDDVRDEAIIFLVAGHETTGSALAFTLQLLGRHQEVQDRARSEVEDAVGGEREPSYDVDALAPHHPGGQRVDAAVPAGPHRRAQGQPRHRPVRLPGAQEPDRRRQHPGHPPPAHVWADPSRFDPDRFGAGVTGERSRSATHCTHLPFGGGRRACIGEHLAMAEMVAAVAALVRRYRLTAQRDEPDLEVDLALRPRGALPCPLEPLGRP